MKIPGLPAVLFLNFFCSNANAALVGNGILVYDDMLNLT